jgi:hypothetical protein
MDRSLEIDGRREWRISRTWVVVAAAISVAALSACGKREDTKAPETTPAPVATPAAVTPSAPAGSSTAAAACASGTTAIASGALYAVYQGGSETQVEDLTAGLSRCMTVVASPPDAAGSGAISAQTAQCSAGTVAVAANTKFASYFGEDKDHALQIEDLRGAPARCITLAPKAGPGNSCTPPKRERVIDGTRYCIG